MDAPRPEELVAECAEGLRPGDRLVARTAHHRPEGRTRRPALDELARLCRAANPAQIGRTGPPLAALAHDPEETDPALRKYEAVFARDSLMISRFVQGSWPALAESSVLVLGAHQGSCHDPAGDQEPGRIPHEIREAADPVAQRITQSNGWSWPYYGSVDATPLFISTARTAIALNPEFARARIPQDTDHERTVVDAVAGALAWLCARLERDGGYLRSVPARVGSIENQFWKDSHDAYSYRDGTVADAPLSSVEAQALAVDACEDGAALLEQAGMTHGLVRRARGLGALALTRLYDGFVELKAGVPVALGVAWPEGGSAPVRLDRRSSNVGHLLCTRALDGAAHRALQAAVIAELARPELLGAAGVRTLATTEARYWPSSYHNGSVWLWDTAVCGFGLIRVGEQRAGEALLRCVLGDCEVFGGYPEFARGDSGEVPSFTAETVEVIEASGRRNCIEQPAQEIQGWTVAAVVAIEEYFATGALPPAWSSPMET